MSLTFNFQVPLAKPVNKSKDWAGLNVPVNGATPLPIAFKLLFLNQNLTIFFNKVK